MSGGEVATKLLAVKVTKSDKHAARIDPVELSRGFFCRDAQQRLFGDVIDYARAEWSICS